jgi:SAM-dependent methyltransferase
MPELPRLYTDLAEWWPVLSAPEDYTEEAEFYRKLIVANSKLPAETLLELGCGGGSNASFLKKHFRLTLSDLSPGMLRVSQALNPECEHIQGDMRTLRLGRTFDAVFIHDAIMYMTAETDLGAAIHTAALHCKPGGVAIFAPDYTRENWQPSTSHGGEDRTGRSLRYLEWTHDPDPDDDTYIVDFAYLLRDESGQVRCEYDRHVFGLFPRATWLRLMGEAGFSAQAVVFEHSEIEPGTCETFIGVR